MIRTISGEMKEIPEKLFNLKNLRSLYVIYF